ncbi:MAG: glutathione S-transferase family protein [Halioglobus sp.]
MKLYGYDNAPNPRRVLIFAAEKGVSLNVVNVDILKGEQKEPDFLARSPSGKIPVLELDDGTCIAESVAISRYLEALHPEPNLFGSGPREIALIEMHHRFIELELFSQVGVSWVNGPVIAASGLIEPIPAAKERSDALVNAFYERLNEELGSRPFMAGRRFSIADITAYCCIEFAGSLVGLPPDHLLENLWAWHADISQRDSVRRLA